MTDIVSNALKRAQSLVGTSEGRPELDFYPTPPEATTALLDRVSFEGMIYEPACGRGDMAEVISDFGYNVLSTDINDYGYDGALEGSHDFLNLDKDFTEVLSNTEEGINVVTNPPFKHALEFAQTALKLTYSTQGKVALLLKLQFLEGQKRQKFFETYPLEYVYVFSKRLSLTREGATMKNGGMICFAWFVWNHKYNGEPIIRWI